MKQCSFLLIIQYQFYRLKMDVELFFSCLTDVLQFAFILVFKLQFFAINSQSILFFLKLYTLKNSNLTGK